MESNYQLTDSAADFVDRELGGVVLVGVSRERDGGRSPEALGAPHGGGAGHHVGVATPAVHELPLRAGVLGIAVQRVEDNGPGMENSLL